MNNTVLLLTGVMVFGLMLIAVILTIVEFKRIAKKEQKRLAKSKRNDLAGEKLHDN